MGSIKCAGACLSTVKSGRDDRLFYDSNFECRCPVYACSRHELFYRHETKNLAIQSRKEKEKRRNNVLQIKMDRLYGFTESIVSKTNDILKR